MLRIHFLQHWFNLSDPAVGEALYESISMRDFVGIDLGHEPGPDETTVLTAKCRHSLSINTVQGSRGSTQGGYRTRQQLRWYVQQPERASTNIRPKNHRQ